MTHHNVQLPMFVEAEAALSYPVRTYRGKGQRIITSIDGSPIDLTAYPVRTYPQKRGGEAAASRWPGEVLRKPKPSRAAFYWRELRDELLRHYGQECAICGTTERLELDHPAEDGGAHRRRVGASLHDTHAAWRDIRRRGFPAGALQVLCRTCHLEKRRSARLAPQTGAR